MRYVTWFCFLHLALPASEQPLLAWSLQLVEVWLYIEEEEVVNYIIVGVVFIKWLTFTDDPSEKFLFRKFEVVI